MSILVACEKETNVRDGIREVTFKATANKLSINEGESITYQDSSLNVSSRLWSFQGGSIASSDQEIVSVSYTDPSLNEDGEVGNGYLTELEVTHPDGSTESNGFNVKVFPLVKPEFEASTEVAVFGSTIDFTDKTVAGQSEFEDAREDDTLLWEFEGGIPATSTDRNPSVTYPEVGKYSVKLTIYRSAPESRGTTTLEGYIDILLVPPCDNTVNVLGCANFNGESESLADWNAELNPEEPIDPKDRNDRLSVSTEQAFEGVGSIKYSYSEPGAAAFTDVLIDFNEVIDVTEAGNYTLSMEHLGTIMGGTEYVFLFGLVNETGDFQNNFEGRFQADLWNNTTKDFDLEPGQYHVRVQLFNPGFNATQSIDFYMDEIKVIRN